MRRYFDSSLVAGLSLLGLLSNTLLAEPIPVFGTGFDDRGSPLAAGAVDPHYTLVAAPVGVPDSEPTYVVGSDGFRIPGAWTDNDAPPQWIAPGRHTDHWPPGIYVYETTFDLEGLDPATAGINGRWLADDGGVEIELNGQVVNDGQGSPDFAAWETFEIDTGFVARRNVLRFRVRNNSGATVNPTGLRVEVVAATARVGSGEVPGEVVASYDFEDPESASGWSPVRAGRTPGTDQHPPDRFLGEFGNDRVTLELEALAGHSGLLVEFDLYVIRSWDGSGDPDLWSAHVDDALLVQTTFSNMRTVQAYPDEYLEGNWLPRSGALERNTLGFEYSSSSIVDSVYRFAYEVPHTAESATIRFTGEGLDELEEESWGVDNVRVSLIVTSARFLRSDANMDGVVTISDPLLTLNYLFGSGELRCQKSADVDDSGRLDLTDVIGTLGFLFLGTLPPPQPFPGCGLDPSDDELSCVSPSTCG